MIITSITPINYGPFYHPATLELEEDVTVITGSNDAGKSSLLRLIGYCFDYNLESFNENDVNLDRNQEYVGNWSDEHLVQCQMRFAATENTKTNPNDVLATGVMTVGQEYLIDFGFSQGGKTTSAVKQLQGDPVLWQGGFSSGSPVQFRQGTIDVINLPSSQLVREIIDMAAPTSVEQGLLQIAFGIGFNYGQKLANASDLYVLRELDRAATRLNKAVRQILPPALGFTFRLIQTTASKSHIALMVIDQHDGHTSLGLRGRGVQTIITLIGLLLTLRGRTNHTFILYDEPENHLHPDAQHALRRVLEELAAQPLVQVVYSTHSPAMINTWRGRSVRLLQRKMVDDRATTIIHNRPIDNNYQRVRASLGINPSDSLLFAPVSVLVEGVTEAMCLFDVFRKLQEVGVAGFEKVSDILSRTHLIDCEGETIKKIAMLAGFQNVSPVIFLDGDKATAAKDIKKVCTAAQIFLMPPTLEFEDIVPAPIYFQALREVMGFAQLEHDAFVDWNKKNPSTKMFTKRVSDWLYLTGDMENKNYNKAEVMERAIQLVPAEDIRIDELRPFLVAVEQVLDGRND